MNEWINVGCDKDYGNSSVTPTILQYAMHTANVQNYDKIISLPIVTVYSFNCTRVGCKSCAISFALRGLGAVKDLYYLLYNK